MENSVNTIRKGSLSSLLSKPVSQEEINISANSEIMKDLEKYDKKGFNPFSHVLVKKKLQTVAKVYLGIDPKYDIDSLFYNPYEIIRDSVEEAKKNGLTGDVAEKLDWNNNDAKNSSRKVISRIYRTGERLYSSEEVAEIGKYLPPAVANEFEKCVDIVSRQKEIEEEVDRIVNVDGGKAAQQMFLLYDIAKRRLIEEYGNSENEYFRKGYEYVTESGHHHYNPCWKSLEDALRYKDVLKEQGHAEEIYRMRGSRVEDSLLIAIATLPSVENNLILKDEEKESEDIEEIIEDDIDEEEDQTRSRGFHR